MCPIDLVFDTVVKDIHTRCLKDPEDDGGVALEEFRAEYGTAASIRVIQKFINNTD